jgi:hypothetical protein
MVVATLTISSTGFAGVGAPSEDKWPQAINSRPYTLPAGTLSLGAGFNADTDFNSIFLGIGGSNGIGFGITDDLTVAGAYTMLLKPGGQAGRGPLQGTVTYTVAGSEQFQFAPRANFTWSFNDGNAIEYLGVFNKATLGIGAALRVNVNKMLSVFSSGQQFLIGFSDPTPVVFQFPIGLGVQPMDILYFSIEAYLLKWNIRSPTNADINEARNATPVVFNLVVSPSNQLDIALGGTLPDAPVASGVFDTVLYGVNVSYYLSFDD